MSKIINKRLRFCNLRFTISNLFRISNFEFRAFSTRGFTLVEMIVAFGIFAVIMVISAGGLISLIDANRKAQSMKTVVNNLHFAFENMSRNIRTGYNYHCTAVGDTGKPLDCPDVPSDSFAFTDRSNKVVVYWLNEKKQIMRTILGSPEGLPLTAPEIEVEQLRFYVDGADPEDDEQPRVLIVAKGTMLGKGKTVSKFDIQTMVSQRQLDI